MAIALGLAANVSASHPRNGPFSTQQWTIFILTMAHCLDECHFDSRLMSARFSQCCTRGYRLPWAQIHGMLNSSFIIRHSSLAIAALPFLQHRWLIHAMRGCDRLRSCTASVILPQRRKGRAACSVRDRSTALLALPE